eukprot:TRINITY_DN10741_c0_g1_i1.p1 TRINITY_DN10741_c0_g1~~TRINITY_DN10741_c0_g1_i1.p1  ORF type:complete len:362 (-),score=72.29 TRINITY_DN10741_c0_g1_i1:24-1109(-)
MSACDSFLAYDTVKIVKVQDCRLGFLHYLLKFLVVCYVVLQIFIFQEYFVLYSPVGSVRMSLKPPVEYNQSSNLPYCLSHSQKDNHGFDNLRCMYWDENFVVYPIVEDHDMLVTTRVRITNQYLPNCTLFDYNCSYVSDQSQTESFYISEIERFTLLLDHSFYTPYIQRNSIEMKGSLVDSEGNDVGLHSDKSSIGEVGKYDILELSDLLRAAGINSLDDLSTTSDEETLRNSGFVLLVFVDYSNKISFDPTNVEYKISATMINNTEFKAEQPIFTKNIENGRLIWNRHGMRIIINQVGEIGQFDFQTLLLTFVSGLGLTTMSTFVVDFFATKLFPARKTINEHKYLEVGLNLNSEPYRQF